MKSGDSESGKKLIYLIICIICIVYNVSPVDLVSDVIPVVGAIDDAAVTLIPLVMGYRGIAKSSALNY